TRPSTLLSLRWRSVARVGALSTDALLTGRQRRQPLAQTAPLSIDMSSHRTFPARKQGNEKTLVIASLLLTTAAQGQVPQQPQDIKEWNYIMDKWGGMINACANVPEANIAAQGLPNRYNGGGPRLEVLRQVLPRIEERLEFCRNGSVKLQNKRQRS